MSHIFLVANNPKVDKKIFKYLAKINAKIIAFNHCALVSHIQPNIVFVRSTKKKNLYHGMSLTNRKHIKWRQFRKNPRIIFIDNLVTFRFFSNRRPNRYRFIRFKRYVKKYPGRYPSSGYVGIHYVLKHFPTSKIYLVGYTFTAPTHNESFEKRSTHRMIRNRKNPVRGIINTVFDVKKFFPHLFANN